MRRFDLHILCLFLALVSCSSHPEIPEVSSSVDALPSIFPDYTDVTVPSNIAPLNFMLADSAYSGIVAVFESAKGTRHVYGKEEKVMIPQDEWQQLRDESIGGSIKVSVFCQQRSNLQWVGFGQFAINIACDPIDDYVSYRLIEPSYVIYNRMSIAQRQLSSFGESEIFNNMVTGNNRNGQCINCHSYQNYGTDNMMFHVRVLNGGTVIVVDGKPRKVNLKRQNTISAGVYPSWHPTRRLIAFSTNQTHQYFHTADKNKVEVFDTESDLVLYDIDRDSVLVIANDSDRLEVFPTWTPDGKGLYYCSAPAQEANSDDYRSDFKELRYNLYYRPFDPSTLSFGEEETVYVADSLGRSVSLPRVSPDGQFLAFAEGGYGCFNIWHHDADIRVMRLAQDSIVCSQPMFINASGLNSQHYAESYPSWSSNGRWLMCASRRDDGNYSRIYISYFDGEKIHKAFELPQEDPQQNIVRLKSYNRPEFMKESVKVSLREFARTVGER